jgi:hypothetical protein
MTVDLRIQAHSSWRTLQLRLSWHESAFAGSLALPFLRLVLRIRSDDPTPTWSAT